MGPQEFTTHVEFAEETMGYGGVSTRSAPSYPEPVLCSSSHNTARAAIFAGWDPWKAGDILSGPGYSLRLRDVQLPVSVGHFPFGPSLPSQTVRSPDCENLKGSHSTSVLFFCEVQNPSRDNNEGKHRRMKMGQKRNID